MDLNDLKTSLLETAMFLEERERECDVLQYQNKKLTRECEDLERRNQQLLRKSSSGSGLVKPLCYETGTNTSVPRTADKECSVVFHNFCCDDKMLIYKDKIIQQKSSELEDVYGEYQLLLKENECLRKNHKLPPRDRKQLRRSRLIPGKVDQCTMTDSPHTSDSGTNTVRTFMPGMGLHKKCVDREFERLRNFLLAEVMSLQLLYSMFDLKTRAQLEKESKLDPDHLASSLSAQRATSSTSTTPSGYETGSEMTVDDRSKHTTTKRGRTKLHKKLHKSNLPQWETSNNKSCSTPHIESAVPKAGNSIEEIIEAQRSGSYLLSNPTEIKDLPIETRVALLKKEICQQKKAMDEELSKVAIQQFGIVEPG